MSRFERVVSDVEMFVIWCLPANVRDRSIWRQVSEFSLEFRYEICFKQFHYFFQVLFQGILLGFLAGLFGGYLIGFGCFVCHKLLAIVSKARFQFSFKI